MFYGWQHFSCDRIRLPGGIGEAAGDPDGRAESRTAADRSATLRSASHRPHGTSAGSRCPRPGQVVRPDASRCDPNGPVLAADDSCASPLRRPSTLTAGKVAHGEAGLSIPSRNSTRIPKHTGGAHGRSQPAHRLRVCFLLVCFLSAGRCLSGLAWSGCRSSITRNSLTAPPGSSSAPLRSLRAAASSTTAICTNWP